MGPKRCNGLFHNNFTITTINVRWLEIYSYHYTFCSTASQKVSLPRVWKPHFKNTLSDSDFTSLFYKNSMHYRFIFSGRQRNCFFRHDLGPLAHQGKAFGRWNILEFQMFPKEYASRRSYKQNSFPIARYIQVQSRAC